MSIGRRITDLEPTESVSSGANYLVETAAGSMRIRHDNLAKEIGKYLAIEDEFEGTNGISSGKRGLVPAPTAEEKDYILSANGIWIPFTADNLKFADGKDAEEKLGMIDGLTSDLNCEVEGIAASAVALKKVNDSLTKKIKYGVTSVPTNGDVYTEQSITFEEPFEKLPTITVSCISAGQMFNIPSLAIRYISTTEFRIAIKPNYGSGLNTNVYWIAIAI